MRVAAIAWLNSWKVKIFIGMEWALVGVKGKPVYDREFGHGLGIFLIYCDYLENAE